MLLAAYERLTQPYPQAAPAIVAAYQAETVLLAELLERLLNHKTVQLKAMQRLSRQRSTPRRGGVCVLAGSR